ncbi:ABC transporter permease, partial [Candidatus Geothermarchaeota archaeon]
IVIAMLGGLNPIGVPLAAFLLSVIITGTQAMHRVTGVPYPIAEVMQGLFLVTLPLSEFFAKYRIKVRVK